MRGRRWIRGSAVLVCCVALMWAGYHWLFDGLQSVNSSGEQEASTVPAVDDQEDEKQDKERGYQHEANEVPLEEATFEAIKRTTLTEPLFTNDFYALFVQEDGQIVIMNRDEHVIVETMEFYAQYGTYYNATQPINMSPVRKEDPMIVLDQLPDGQVGDTIEILSEYRNGRMNDPLIHTATIEKIEKEEKTIHFSPAFSKAFNRGIFIRDVQHEQQGFDSVSLEQKERDTGKVIKLVGTNAFNELQIRITLDEASPDIRFDVHRHYTEDGVRVFEEALLFQFAPNVREVYRKNRQVDREDLQDEYWLDQQGVMFGADSQSALIYHTPDVSSLALQVPEQTLRIYLDHEHDQRYFEHDSSHLGTVRHAAEYGRGDEAVNSFTIRIGDEPGMVPRPMLQPHGYLATHIWTEHADFGTLETHRAVYYGSEEIKSADEAIGGFIKYDIPVTKSVFYANPTDRYMRNDPDLGKELAMMEDPAYAQFLMDVHDHGVEIGLHTAQADNADREMTKEAIQYMKEHYDTVTWIDHASNKTNFGFEGLNRASPYYVGDVWEEYDTRYFWQYSSEDIADTHPQELNLLWLRDGDHHHTPLYWQHPTVTGDFYTWSAATMYRLPLYTDYNLQSLVDDWGVFINHTYPPRIKPTYSASMREVNAYYMTDEQGQAVAHPDFNHILKQMDSLRNKGKLYLTTVRDIMDYWIALENISFTYMEDGSVRVENHHTEEINGLAFAIGDSTAYVGGETPEYNVVGDERVIWFDLEAKSYTTIADTMIRSKRSGLLDDM